MKIVKKWLNRLAFRILGERVVVLACDHAVSEREFLYSRENLEDLVKSEMSRKIAHKILADGHLKIESKDWYKQGTRIYTGRIYIIRQ